MPIRPLTLLLFCILNFEANAGAIHGIVRAESPEPPGGATASSAYESRKFKFAERINYAELKDFVVYIDQIPAEKPAPPSKPVQIVTQKDATFKPHVLPLLVGTTVEWPNQDEIFHNVFSDSPSKQFDLGFYKGEVKAVKFDKPGRIDVFCSIHTKMHCILLILENPHFAAADDKGRYAITNVPPGTYQVKAWHERLPSVTRTVTVPATGAVKVDLILGLKHLPKY